MKTEEGRAGDERLLPWATISLFLWNLGLTPSSSSLSRHGRAHWHLEKEDTPFCVMFSQHLPKRALP